MAARSLGVAVVLVGKADLIQAELARFGDAATADKITVVDTPEWIEMGESPGCALRKKKQASVVLAAKLVAQGKAQAMVSAGNSGAAMGAAVLHMGTMPGVERPAIALVLPTQAGGEFILLDAGATVDCHPKNLVDFAHMGVAYASCRMGLEQPRVGLLGIGEEPKKGNLLARNAYELLQVDQLNFVGNIEPNGMFHGEADVIVCDGFVGNIALKTMEGFGELTIRLLLGQSSDKTASDQTLLARIQRARQRLDWTEYGGALLLGVKGLCIISHGRSTPTAIARAIQAGKVAAEKQVIGSVMQHFPQPVDAGQ